MQTVENKMDNDTKTNLMGDITWSNQILKHNYTKKRTNRHEQKNSFQFVLIRLNKN